VKYLRDFEGATHLDGATAAGEFTLCGLAQEGERGDQQMVETSGPIDCPTCVGIIRYCKGLKSYQFKSNK
jgi:hypothetical protein